MKKIEVRWQSWHDKKPEYEIFNRENVGVAEESALSRYEYCLMRFLNLDEEARANGIIFAGLEYDFSFKEVDDDEIEK